MRHPGLLFSLAWIRNLPVSQITDAGRTNCWEPKRGRTRSRSIPLGWPSPEQGNIFQFLNGWICMLLGLSDPHLNLVRGTDLRIRIRIWICIRIHTKMSRIRNTAWIRIQELSNIITYKKIIKFMGSILQKCSLSAILVTGLFQFLEKM